MTRRVVGGGFVASVLAVVTMACGGGSSSPTSPGGGGTGGPGPVGATITITAGGVSPASVSISVGQSVTLVNNDSRSHQISSNPHPAHTDCAVLNFGSLGAEQSRTSDALTTARTCGYHDHLDPTNSLWQGQVTIR